MTQLSLAHARAAQNPAFCHLHVHTDHSLGDGGTNIHDMVKQAKSQGMTALAITDHGTMSGIPEFYRECKKNDIHPVLGVEVYASTDLTSRAYSHLTLLCENYEGYKNLCKITSQAHLENYHYKPRVLIDKNTWQVSDPNNLGIICLTGCSGGFVAGHLFRDGNLTAAKNALDLLIQTFGRGNTYVELMDQGYARDVPAGSELDAMGITHLTQEKANEILSDLAHDAGVECVATADVHYAKIGDAEAHDAVLCLHTGQKKHGTRKFSMLPELYHLRTEQDMQTLFSAYPEALANTQIIAERCQVDLDVLKKRTKHSRLQVTDADTKLADLVAKKAPVKLGSLASDPAYQARLDEELRIFTSKDESSRVLMLADLVAYAIQKDIMPAPGFGAAASSLVLFVLGVTEIDPIKYNLPIERLTGGNFAMQVDLAFARDGYAQVGEYLDKKYFAYQLSTAHKISSRAALRDAARVFDYPKVEADRLIAEISNDAWQGNLVDSLAKSTLLMDAYKNTGTRPMMEFAMTLNGLIRAQSIQPGAHFFHADDDLVPLIQKGSHNPVVSAYSVRDLRELRYDVQNVVSFVVLEHLQTVQSQLGISDYYQLPEDDMLAYQMLASGRSMGIYQMQGETMEQVLATAKPTNLFDLACLAALSRPGADNNIPAYVNRENNAPVELDALVRQMLPETHGMCIFQEQLMHIATLAGLTKEEANDMRRDMGKRAYERCSTWKDKFVPGIVRAFGVSTELSEKLWEHLLNDASPYSFSMSHALASAKLTYLTAYVKARDPKLFLQVFCDSQHLSPRQAKRLSNEKTFYRYTS